MTWLKDIWLVVWNIFYFPIYWECHHPNWLIFFRGVLSTTNHIHRLSIDNPYTNHIQYYIETTNQFHWLVLISPATGLSTPVPSIKSRPCQSAMHGAPRAEQNRWKASGWNLQIFWPWNRLYKRVKACEKTMRENHVRKLCQKTMWEKNVKLGDHVVGTVEPASKWNISAELIYLWRWTFLLDVTPAPAWGSWAIGSYR